LQTKANENLNQRNTPKEDQKFPKKGTKPPKGMVKLPEPNREGKGTS